MFKHKSTSGSNCFVTFILPEGALFVYQLFAEQSIILNLKQKRKPVSTEFLFCYLTEFCPSLFIYIWGTIWNVFPAFLYLLDIVIVILIPKWMQNLGRML